MDSADPISVLTPDGRMLSGLSFGPSNGDPVLFMAGAATGKSMHFGADLLRDMNVRLLTMDRPGMGASTFHSERTLASTADDYRSFVETVIGRSDTLPVVANSQASVFGLAAAADGWASKLILVSPADELAHPQIHAMLPAEATQLSDLARASPREAERVLAMLTPGDMESMVLEGASEKDRTFYLGGSFLSLYRRALIEGFACNGRGYVRDTLIAMRPWGLRLSDIRTAVTIMFGAGDLGHSPDHGATLADRMTNVRREVLSEAGGALLWTHARRVFESIFCREDLRSD